MNQQRPNFDCDTECYHDFWLCKFLDERTNQYYEVSAYPGQDLDRQYLANILAACRTYTFNGNGYDIPMITLALAGAGTDALKEANDRIIGGGWKPWTFFDYYGIQVPEWIDHVDISEVAPGVRISLKAYGGRMHAPKIQDLPFDPHERPDAIKRFVLNDYCGNDLQTTKLLRHELRDRLALREAISARYKTNVMSKSDAQIAEAVILSQLDFRPEPRYIPHGFTFKYEPPAYIKFYTPQLRALLDMIRNANFLVSDKEEAHDLGMFEVVRTGVMIPDELKGLDIRVGGSIYRMGIGGLHSQEASTYHLSVPGVQEIWDVDVKSYYPSLILRQQMYPSQSGPGFLKIYEKVYHTRLHAKSEADRIMALYEGMGAAELKKEADDFKTEADGLKIVLNGTFGKLFSKYSRPLYAPELGIKVTMTGQLSLLMLIEMMELMGIRVASANTDGIVLIVPHGREQLARDNVSWWERTTGLEMEYSNYRSIWQRDVNNYIAITDKGKVKRKGVFGQGGLLSGPQGKHPDKDICADAVVAWLKDQVPLAQTIRECNDIRKFVQIRGVKGGGVYMPHGTLTPPDQRAYLGKVVRWYYGGNENGYIAYTDSGNKVAGSQGATPVMELPDALPADINYQHYIDVAKGMLADVGAPYE